MSKTKPEKQSKITAESSVEFPGPMARRITEEEIALRAYALYLVNRETVSDVDNWLQAERELLAEISREQEANALEEDIA